MYFREIHDTAPSSLCTLARGVQYQQLNQHCREDNANTDVLCLATSLNHISNKF